MRKKFNNTKGGSYASYNNTIPREGLKDMPQQNASYNIDYDNDNKAKTAYNTIRNYDVTVDKIDLKISGAAPIFGDKNKVQVLSWQNDIKANYTGSLNTMYAYNEMRTVGIIYRDVEINYQGIDITRKLTLQDFNTGVSPERELYNNNIGLRRWNSSVSTLIGELEAAIYRDLPINDIEFANTTAVTNACGYLSGFSSLAAALYQYQQELSAFLTTLVQFQYLVAMLPKLAELYPQYAPFFNYIQNQLKTTRYTSLVRSTMMAIKRRFVDKKFFQDFVLPCSVYSQETDGINSPIVYLRNHQTIMNSKYSMNGGTTSTRLNTYAIDWTANANAGYVDRTLDAFTLDTLMNIVLAQNYLNPGQLTQNQDIATYLEQARASLNTLAAAAIDFGNNQIVIAIETALNKLKVAPGAPAMQWSNDIDFNEIANISRLDKWDMVDTIVFHSIYPLHLNNNGFTMRVPMYRRTGFSKQLMLEYFQVFYTNMPERFISFVHIYNTVYTRMRNRATVNYTWVVNNQSGNGAWVVTGVQAYGNNNAALDYMTTADFMTTFSDKFVQVNVVMARQNNISIVKAVPNPIPNNTVVATLTNPELMGFVDYAIVNRASEIEVSLMRNFIIPLA